MARNRHKKHTNPATKKEHIGELHAAIDNVQNGLAMPAGRVDATIPTAPKWWTNPDWWMVGLTALIALFAMFSFIELWVQLADARENFAKDQRPYV